MRRLFILFIILTAAMLAGCVSTRPILEPQYPPVRTPEPSVVIAEPTLEPAATPSADPLSGPDALGNQVSGPEHYKQYLAFKNMQVYEYNGDTFFDTIVSSSYPEPIVCAVDILFFEESEQVAEAKLQTRDGQYMLIIPPGESALYARVNTDMDLIPLNYDMRFDDTVSIIPRPDPSASPGV